MVAGWERQLAACSAVWVELPSVWPVRWKAGGQAWLGPLLIVPRAWYSSHSMPRALEDMLLKIPGPPNGPTHLPNSHFLTNTPLELTFFMFYLQTESECIQTNNVATKTLALLDYYICCNHTLFYTFSKYLPLFLSFFHTSSLRPLTLSLLPFRWVSRSAGQHLFTLCLGNCPLHVKCSH